MATRPTTSTTAASTPVPMLDVRRQNGPLLAEIEAEISSICASGAFVNGPACREFESDIAKFCGTQHAVGCASGSDALLLALMALGVEAGDEVVIPSFTFFATASAVTRLGATPVFADILPDTFNIDPSDVAKKITPATKAIMPVHLFGQCADMKQLTAISEEAGLPIVEDAAQAIGAEYYGQRAGSMGKLGCFSFYPTKNLGGFGDGGIITTDDKEIADQLRILRDHGQHPRYHHSTVGVNSRLDTIQAAVLKIKLKHLEGWSAGRDRNAKFYAQEFVEKEIEKQLGVPTVAEGCQSIWNQYTVRVTEGRRDAMQQWLADRQIGSAVYYPIPLHLQECFAEWGYREGSLPVTEQAAKEVLSLPIFAELESAELAQVVQAIGDFFCGEEAVDDASQAA